MAKKPKSKRTRSQGSLAKFPKGMVGRMPPKAKRADGLGPKAAQANALLGQESSTAPLAQGGPAQNPRLAMTNWTPSAKSSDETTQAEQDESE